jgi:hypothetical protein
MPGPYRTTLKKYVREGFIGKWYYTIESAESTSSRNKMVLMPGINAQNVVEKF